MYSQCLRPWGEMRDEARRELSSFVGEFVTERDVKHVRWEKQYPSSAGPFRGRIACQAFWWFDMDAFVCDVTEDGGEASQIAAVFAAGRFWSIVQWSMKIDMEPVSATLQKGK